MYGWIAMKGILTLALIINMTSMVGRATILPRNKKELCCVKDSHWIFFWLLQYTHICVLYKCENTSVWISSNKRTEQDIFFKTDHNLKQNTTWSSKRYFLLSLVIKIIKRIRSIKPTRSIKQTQYIKPAHQLRVLRQPKETES